MILKEVIQKSLEELYEITKLEASLFLPDGTCYAGTMGEEEDVEPALLSFLHSGAQFQELLGYYLYRFNEEEDYILVVSGSKTDAKVLGQLALSQIQNLILVDQEKNSKDNFLKSLMEGKVPEAVALAKAEKFRLNLDEKRAVFLIEYMEGNEEDIFEIIQNMGETPEEDFLLKIEDNIIALIKKMQEDEGEEDQRELARAFVDTINAEMMTKVRVSYGSCVDQMMELARSFSEARTALEIGQIFYADQKTISYQKLGIGRLLYRLPEDLCETFMKEVIGDNFEGEIDAESLGTIYRFFENGLNVSETARQLYVHRNTLVYRLEKIQKQLGLDVRQFDDAVTFKIAMMVDSYLKWKKRQE